MGNVFNRQKPMYNFRLHSYKKVLHSVRSERIPVARSGHRIVCDGSNFYSFGGYNPVSNSYSGDEDDEISQAFFPLFRELWRFNFATLKWSLYKIRNNLPVELASNAVILLGNQLLVRIAYLFKFLFKKNSFKNNYFLT